MKKRYPSFRRRPESRVYEEKISVIPAQAGIQGLVRTDITSLSFRRRPESRVYEEKISVIPAKAGIQ